jgi:hypothetical protein
VQSAPKITSSQKRPTERGFEIFLEVKPFKDTTINKAFNFMTSFINRASIRTADPRPNATAFTIDLQQVVLLHNHEVPVGVIVKLFHIMIV